MTMTTAGVVHILLYFVVVLLLTKPLGAYMATVFEGSGRLPTRLFAPVERVVYRVCCIDPSAEMDWRRYGISVLLFSALSMFSCTWCCGCRVTSR